MKTVRDACQLQDNALSIRLSDQIEQLDELITAEGDGAAFYEKTHITQGMQDLITEGIARLAGASSQAVFHLKQAMGGGKTHLLVGFGLLAKHPGLRKTYCAGMPHASAFGSANIAAFNGRNNPDYFFWGEIANQLGKGDQFKAFWTSGPKAPGEKDWLKLFEGEHPILILLDEMPPYFHYLDTQKVGNGTVADIATRAFANLLTAAGKKKNVCVVVSDLAAAYDTGARLINRALEDARSELGRQERTITPVDLAANEIYDILRKRLFKQSPNKAEIEDIAHAYGRKLEEAAKSKTANRGAEAIADEIVATYPFHPRLKNVIALFKENEQFKQTRGLIELVSRLLRSVWDRQANDVFLIGPQHFDLGIAEVRDKLTEISGMRDVIAKDLWDVQHSAHAQVIDLQTGKEAAPQIGALLLTASLSTAVNAVKGLTREEMVECLISPLREPSEFLAAFEELEKVAWYVHHTPEGRFRLNILVCDPSGQYETGDPITWSNRLILRNQLTEKDGKRTVELLVAPKGIVHYTLDGSEPRDGSAYDGPITIGDGDVLLLGFAEASGLEAKAEFRFGPKGKKGIEIDEVKPAQLVSRTGRKLDSRGRTFEALKQAGDKSSTFEGIVLTVGQGNQMIAINVGEIAVEAGFLEALLTKVLEKFAPDTPITMTFRKAAFASGHDLKDFAGKLDIELGPGDVQQ